jgi:hypothetical protein
VTPQPIGIAEIGQREHHTCGPLAVDFVAHATNITGRT